MALYEDEDEDDKNEEEQYDDDDEEEEELVEARPKIETHCDFPWGGGHHHPSLPSALARTLKPQPAHFSTPAHQP